MTNRQLVLYTYGILSDLAEHYETTILPARAYRPRDKSLVEGAVKILYRRIYANLRT